MTLKHHDPLQEPRHIMRGEEGLVEQLPEPTIAGTTVRKTFHTNHYLVPLSGGMEIPVLRFRYGSTRGGYFRLYHAMRLARYLEPEHFVDVRAAVVPVNLPPLFNEKTPPTDAKGNPAYPEIHSKLINPGKEWMDNLREFYRIIRDTNITREEKGCLAGEIDHRARELGGKEFERLVARFDDVGLPIIHPEVNCVESNGKLVFFELDPDVEHLKIGDHITTLPAERQKHAGYLLGKVIKEEHAALKELAADPRRLREEIKYQARYPTEIPPRILTEQAINGIWTLPNRHFKDSLQYAENMLLAVQQSTDTPSEHPWKAIFNYRSMRDFLAVYDRYGVAGWEEHKDAQALFEYYPTAVRGNPAMYIASRQDYLKRVEQRYAKILQG